MKITAAICLIGLPSIQAGEFINLDFNSPDLAGNLVPLLPGGPFLGSAQQLIPGWKITGDGKDVSDVTYSLYRQTTGSTIATLRQGDPNSGLGYSLTLLSTHSNDGKPGPDIWVSQTGTIPANASGIKIYGGSLVEGYINGRQIGQTDPNKGRFFVWDVSEYQGKEVTIQIHSPSGWVNEFDVVGFTTVPEPSPLAMLALGLGIVGWRSIKRR